MDKREEDVLDDILGGDEIDDLTEIEEVVIPESLRGEPNDKTEPESENKSEEKAVDLSDFLDDNTEVDVSIDPELDKALSAFADDGSDEKENKEKEEAETTAKKKAKKSKMILSISLICLVAVLLIAGGLFVFFRLDNPSSGGNIMKFNGKNISMDEFKLFVLLTGSKEGALEGLTEFLTLDKAAKDKKIVLNEENQALVDSYVDVIKDEYIAPGEIKNISDERIKSILSFLTQVINGELMEKIAVEKNYKFDEAVLATEVEGYRARDKFIKYIITNKRQEAKDVLNLLSSDSITIDEAIKLYSVLHDESQGIEKIDLSELMNNLYSQYGLMLIDNDYNKVMELKASEISEEFNLGIIIIFITATDEEAVEYFRNNYEGEEADFETELANYYLNNKLLKYIVAETQEKAEEARKALLDGLDPEEAIKKYSIYYDESAGIEKVELSWMGFSEEENAKIMALQESEFSEIIEFGPFIIFIETTSKETEDRVKDESEYSQKYSLYEEEYNSWKEKAKIKVNDKLFDEFDADAYLQSVYGGY